MPSDYTKPVPVSSSFRSENSGKASPSLYARQSPLPLPCPQQPLPGQSNPASAGEAAEHSLGSLLQGSRCSTPQPSLPSSQQATLSGNPCCQPQACPMVSELGREPLTLESSPISGVPRTYGCVSALLVTLRRNTSACSAQPSVWAVLYSRDCQASPLHRSPIALSGPGGRGIPTHPHTSSVGAALSALFRIHSVVPPSVRLGPPFPLSP